MIQMPLSAKLKNIFMMNCCRKWRAGGHPAQIVNKAVARYPGLTPCADSPAVMLAQSLSGLSNYAVVPLAPILVILKKTIFPPC